MKTCVITESISSFFDIGAVFESIRHYRKYGLEMDLVEFAKILVLGKGYQNLTPPQFSEKLATANPSPAVIDLREVEKFNQTSISNAISEWVFDPEDPQHRQVPLNEVVILAAFVINSGEKVSVIVILDLLLVLLH